MKTVRHVTYVLLCLVVLAAVSPAYAQDGGTPPSREVTDDEVNAIAKKLYCPVCENVPLDVCETQACADWRSEIRMMLEQGQSEEQILTYFKNRYGQRVLAVPDAEGINLIVWVVPPLAAIAGVAILAAVLRRMAPGAASQPIAAAQTISYDDLDPEYVARLEREVQEFTG
jgi:cytochrome c-type biogenesis protein CcmH